MAEIDLGQSTLGSALAQILLAPDIQPGDTISYELAKAIYLSHPLGAKMVDAPIKKAQAQAREISVPASPEDRVVQAFREEWDRIGADEIIAQTASVARIYGVGSLVYGAPAIPTDKPIDPWKLAGLPIYFNVLDPLNTAGSLVLNQDPNSPDYQKWVAVTAAGQPYNRARSVVVMNERPMYIAYTASAFGYTGRSVYQRALYPLKSFIETMITDNMVAQKAGLLVVKQKQPGSIVNRMMDAASGIKRSLLQSGRTGNVLTVGHEDEINSLNFQNLEGPTALVRTNILKNIATAADMPAVMLENETLTEGFGEGSEDAKMIADYIDGIRKWMKPLYDFMDSVVQYRAWSPAFYASIQEDYPEYKRVDYKAAFYQWRNSFSAVWPNLLKEPDSELVKVDEIKLKAIVSMLEAAAPQLDPFNKAALFQWAADNLNQLKLMFPDQWMLDAEALEAHFESAAAQAEEAAQAEPSPSLKLAS